MHRSSTRTRLLRGGLIAIVLSLAGALVAFASLPSAADDGQARAAAGAANSQADAQGQAPDQPDENTGEGQSTALDQLAENQDRLFATLSRVWDQLNDNANVPDAAKDAIQNVIDMLGGDIGLNRAIDAVGGDTGAPELPEAAGDHPSQP
jgi:Flp pilus assembly protein TadG